MFNKARPARDAFTFSLGGVSTIGSFVAPTAIADDRINRIRDEQLQRNCNNRASKSGTAVFRRPHVAIGLPHVAIGLPHAAIGC